MSASSAQAWLDTDLETVRKLWIDEGLSASVIAARFPGRSRNAVIGVVTRRGWKRAESEGTRRLRVKLATPKPKATARPAFGFMRPNPDPQPPPPPKLHAVTASPVTVPQLTATHCRFPVGAASGADQLFCGEEREHEHTSYCRAHRLISVSSTPLSKISIPKAA